MPYPLTKTEERAIEATRLASFPVNLEEVKRTVEGLLSRVAGKFFSQYTVHDFAHVHGMLSNFDWIIPSETVSAMTPGDWLTLTLSCYFHDIGLLITDDEYENRQSSKYLEFAEKTLFSGPDRPDYKEKVAKLGLDERERFLYQEFVRANHGARVRAWVSGEGDPTVGVAKVGNYTVDTTSAMGCVRASPM